MKKSEGKEAYRLWFEFLRRAFISDKHKVDVSCYADWDDVANITFTRWWRETGTHLLASAHVRIADSSEAASDSIQLSVPLSLTPTDAGNSVREFLLQHYAEIKHTPKRRKGFRLTEGKEIKVRSFRAYLITYDAYRRLLVQQSRGELISSINRTGKRGRPDSKLAFPAKLLLSEVRKSYAAKSRRYSKNKFKVDSLPTALSETADNEAGALKSIRRHIDIADKVLHNVARGEFPGEYQ